MSWTTDLPPAQYLGLQTPAHELQRVVNEVYHAHTVAIDTETTGLIKCESIPLYWSIAWGHQRAMLDAALLPHFKVCFENPHITWPLANAKFDMHMLANVGIHITGKWHDVQVMHSLLFDDKPHALKLIAAHLLGWTWGSFEDQFGKITKEHGPQELIERAAATNLPLLTQYAANDAWGTLKIYEYLCDMLKRERTYSLFTRCPPYIETLWDVFSKVESPYTKVLWKTERRGIKLDKARLEEAKPEAKQKLDDLLREANMILRNEGLLHIFGGAPFNPRSSAHIRALADALNLKPMKYTKGGKTTGPQPSWDADALEAYKHESPIIDLILDYKSCDKLLGTYIEGLAGFLDKNDRIHANFNQSVARTGRLSSSEPNLQNIPKPENDEWKLRAAFITDPGYELICADYSQLEMRLLACAAQEQAMVDVFIRGWDVHAGNAALMFNGNYDDINNSKDLLKEAKKKQLDATQTLDLFESKLPGVCQRAQSYNTDVTTYLSACAGYRGAAKAIGFGLNYGMGPNKLAGDIGCSVEEAKEKIAQYKATYPAVERFMAEAIEEAKASGFAFTILGRRRNIPMIQSNNKGERALGERLAVNTQIQGSAADVTRMAHLNIDTIGLDRDYDCHSVLQVHDELVYEAPVQHVDYCLQVVEHMMASPFAVELLCPLIAEGGRGKNWMEAK